MPAVGVLGIIPRARAEAWQRAVLNKRKENEMPVKFINLTPHELNIKEEGGSFLTIPRSGSVARVQTTTETVGTIAGVSVTRQKFADEIDGVPQRKEETYYVVSRLAAEALKEAGRTDDILIPGAAIRDDSGKIIGCAGFSTL